METETQYQNRRTQEIKARKVAAADYAHIKACAITGAPMNREKVLRLKAWTDSTGMHGHQA